METARTLLAQSGPRRFFSGWTWRTGRMVLQWWVREVAASVAAADQHLPNSQLPLHGVSGQTVAGFVPPPLQVRAMKAGQGGERGGRGR